MLTAQTIAECRAAVAERRKAGARIALVPTMGALHEGHLVLMDEARSRGDTVVMSLFVNPLQFAPGEDYDRYPRDLEGDARLATGRGVDVLFAPSAAEMYPRSLEVGVKAGLMASEWEGSVRPGHFDGVLTVVAKLFHIVEPDVAIFGQKDLQQAMLVAAMIRDLDMPVELVVVPTVRDEDGLALSSRNRYFSPEDRRTALALPRALQAIHQAYSSGERDVAELETAGHNILNAMPGLKVDYLAVVERETFRRPYVLEGTGAAIGAVRVGETRLIDNLLLGGGGAVLDG